MQEVFSKRDIPVVPSLGTLPVYPQLTPERFQKITTHYYFTPGNNDVWRAFNFPFLDTC